MTQINASRLLLPVPFALIIKVYNLIGGINILFSLASILCNSFIILVSMNLPTVSTTIHVPLRLATLWEDDGYKDS